MHLDIRIRRVKCDETKLSCKRCTSTGRKCDGYGLFALNKTKKSKDAIKCLSEAVSSSVTLYSPSVDIEGSMDERRSFHYFRSRNMAQLPGNFEPYFWDHLVLQFSHQDRTIRHCLIALSAIYETHERDSRNPMTSLTLQSRSPYVLVQYNKAVRHLVDSISCDDQDPRVTLISCLIFVWIEFLQNDLDSGLQHLKCGLKILRDQGWRGYPTTNMISVLRYDADDIYGSLNRSFTRLSIQAAIHGSPTSDFTTSSTMPLFTRAPIPRVFSDMFEARNWFDNEMNSTFGHLRQLRDGHPNQIATENSSLFDLATLNAIRQSYLHRLQQWEAATTRMSMKTHPQDQAQTSGTLYLQLYYTLVVVLLKTLFIRSEMIFDEYTADFERILSLTDRFLNDPRITTTPLLSFDMGVIPPLLFLLLKCRVLSLRRRALDLLKLAPEQEGIWRRESVIRTAGFKIELEEQGRGQLSESEPLPEEARTSQEHVRYSNVRGKRIAFLYYKRGGSGNERAEFLELVAGHGMVEVMGDML
jgi:hypothetical protein